MMTIISLQWKKNDGPGLNTCFWEDLLGQLQAPNSVSARVPCPAGPDSGGLGQAGPGWAPESAFPKAPGQCTLKIPGVVAAAKPPRRASVHPDTASAQDQSVPGEPSAVTYTINSFQMNG